MFLCNTNARCQELAEFCKELSHFCSDIVDIMCFEHLDFQDVKQEWKQKTEDNASETRTQEEAQKKKI